MFKDGTISEIAKVAERLGVPASCLLAVAEVESAGRVTAKVGGRQEPLIRFEGHYFDRLLPAAKRARTRKAGLANPRAGKVRNPRRQAARWALLGRAAAIDHRAAHSSVSWGLGQVMGSHWKWLGYPNVDALVAEARSGAAGQVRLMARFIEKSGLAGTLRRRDWKAFARAYNGPAYAKNRYDTKMAAAEARWRKRTLPQLPEAVAANDDTMRFGARGKRVTELQKALAGAGYPLRADGLFGLKTDKALRAFQRDHRLAETGALGAAENLLLLHDFTGSGMRLGLAFRRMAAWMKTKTLSIARRFA